MSNGDLDGDNYFVSWDTELMEYLDRDSFVDPETNFLLELPVYPDGNARNRIEE